jgi:hypothetical protein
MLAIRATGSVCSSSVTCVGSGAHEVDVMTGNAFVSRMSRLSITTGSRNWRDCSAGALPVPMIIRTSVIPSSGAATRSSSPRSASSSSGCPGCSSFARRYPGAARLGSPSAS